MKRLVLSFAIASLIAATAQSQGKVISVKNATEFVAAIRPNVTLELVGPLYDFGALSEDQSGTYYSIVNEYDGNELRIRNVRNLKIIGKGVKQPHLQARPQYADVIQFENCSGIVIDNVIAGHGPEKGGCKGSVLNFVHCNNVQVNNSNLYGSGTYGITADTLTGLTCKNTAINGCTYGVMNISHGQNLRFEKCRFFDNEGFDMITLKSTVGIVFEKCNITRNTARWGDSYYALFMIAGSRNLVLTDCLIMNNKCLVVYCWQNEQSSCDQLPSDTGFAQKNCTVKDNGNP